jgi:hypothetical protein
MPKLATLRRPIALLVAAGLHVAVLGAGFWSASHEPAPKEPAVVTVLTGHVATDGTGDFEATGFRQARITQR